MEKKLHKVAEGKILTGVGSGIATYFNVNVWLVRILFVICGLVGLISYIVLSQALPETAEGDEADFAAKFYKTAENKIINGVCSGIGKSFKINLWLVRILFVICGLGGLLVYIALSAVLPEKNAQ